MSRLNTPKPIPKPRKVCRHCQDRYVGCHSSCQRYLDEKREIEADLMRQVKAYQGEREAERYTMLVCAKIKYAKKGAKKNGL